jgi:hypothetical protein
MQQFAKVMNLVFDFLHFIMVNFKAIKVMESSLNLALKFIVSLLDFLARNTCWLQLLIAFNFAALKIFSTKHTAVTELVEVRLWNRVHPGLAVNYR